MSRPPLPMPGRFWDKVQMAGPDQCWLWTGAQTWNGYGFFSVKSRNKRAHRFAYELAVGPIPEGLTIDHLCRTPLCVNPAHLEPVTMWINTMRGNGIAAQNARKTHCKRGHPFDEANTYPQHGGRGCRACARAYAARKKERAA